MPPLRSSRRRNRCLALAAVGSLLAAACPLSAVARPVASSARASSAPRATAPIPVTRQPLSFSADRDSLSTTDRLSIDMAQSYDIVPPADGNRGVKGPIPGYQIVGLGRGRNNRLCFAATVNGVKGLMMVDTGAQATVLNATTYRPLLSEAARALPAGLPRAVTLNGTRLPLAEAPDFHVGPANLGAVPVCMVPDRYLTDAGRGGEQGRVYDGLVGENVLRHYNAVIDCARLGLYLNLDPARKLAMAASFERAGWTRVPMTDTGHHFLVPCVVNGRRFRLVVDTGAPFTNLDLDLLKAAQVGSRTLGVRGGLLASSTEEVSLVDLDRLQIGGYTATGVHMTATARSLQAFGGAHDNAPDQPILGLLGGDILASNRAVVDLGGRMLYLKHPDTR
ncbi:MAG: aspartyl protease family protein [Gluconacetobacter diazotrophicus]|nr:aspartyl protease family protein [Gluconacetobacter diazotrophicus]